MNGDQSIMDVNSRQLELYGQQDNHPTSRDEVKSDEEWHVILWFQEASDAGLIESWSYEPGSLVLFKPAKYAETKQLKTKTKIVERCLHRGAVYTPDFRFSLTDRGHSLLGPAFKESILTAPEKPLFIDVKGSYNPNDQPRYFSVMQKLVHHLFGIWVKRIVPFYKSGKGSKRKGKGLFYDTFAPESLRWMSRAHELNSMGRECRNLTQFLSDNAQLF